MNPLIELKRTTSVFLVAFALACFGLSPAAQAVSPAPDGGYPGGNTAEGQNALLSLTTGGYNTAVGYFSLRSDTTGSFNTAIGAGTLLANTGNDNTATGAAALLSNTTGGGNTATGFEALSRNTTGHSNTAIGTSALFGNTTGSDNTAIGVGTLSVSTGDFNTAAGYNALFSNTSGGDNVAIGSLALVTNTTGNNNMAFGQSALASNTTGSFNIALGTLAGQNLTTGDYNIDIGNNGIAGDSNAIRIGDDSHQGSTFIAAIYGVAVSGLAVAIDSFDHLGTVGSSQRFKEEIKPMDKASEALYALKPVAFRYKKEIDPARTRQLGLVAEDVEKVNPDLIVRDKEGKPYSVRYDQVNAMLLNEFLKEHRKVEQLTKNFQSKLAEQQKQIEALTAGLQKVSTQLEASKSAPQIAVNDP